MCGVHLDFVFLPLPSVWLCFALGLDTTSPPQWPHGRGDGGGEGTSPAEVSEGHMVGGKCQVGAAFPTLTCADLSVLAQEWRGGQPSADMATGLPGQPEPRGRGGPMWTSPGPSRPLQHHGVAVQVGAGGEQGPTLSLGLGLGEWG